MESTCWINTCWSVDLYLGGSTHLQGEAQWGGRKAGGRKNKKLPSQKNNPCTCKSSPFDRRCKKKPLCLRPCTQCTVWPVLQTKASLNPGGCVQWWEMVEEEEEDVGMLVCEPLQTKERTKANSCTRSEQEKSVRTVLTAKGAKVRPLLAVKSWRQSHFSGGGLEGKVSKQKHSHQQVWCWSFCLQR